MVGVNIGEFFTPTPWPRMMIETALSGARSSGYFDCDAVKFWHCIAERVLPIACQDHIRKVMVHANNNEMLNVRNWEKWITSKLQPIVARIRQCRVYKEIYLVVGNEALAPWNAKPFGARLAPCLREVHAALERTGLADRVKVVTTMEMTVLSLDSNPPSAGQFSSEHKDVIKEVVGLLVRIGSPFCMNVYPYFVRDKGHISNYVLFGPNGGVLDGDKRYTDMFSAQYDATVTALSKLDIEGADSMEVVVTETGWPSAGGYMANKANARRYTAEVIEISMRGTPLRPGRMDMYLFELYDESSKDGAYEEKHFGLFDIEGNPK